MPPANMVALSAATTMHGATNDAASCACRHAIIVIVVISNNQPTTCAAVPQPQLALSNKVDRRLLVCRLSLAADVVVIPPTAATAAASQEMRFAINNSQCRTTAATYHDAPRYHQQ
jgi:hypothetical protein